MGETQINSQCSFLTSDTFTRTDLTTADKVHRLIHKIESRCSYFDEQVEYRVNHPEYEFYKKEFDKFQTKTNDHLKKLRGVGNNYNNNKTKDRNEKISRKAERKISEENRDENVYRNSYTWTKKWEKRKEHIHREIGIKMPEEHWNEGNDEMEFILEMMRESAQMTSVEVIKARLIMEMIEAYKTEWYMIFNTITVRPEDYETVFEKGSNVWRNYIRQIKRSVATTLYGSWRQSMGHDYFHYLAVVEEGASNGRLHIHAMLFMKGLTKIKADGTKGAHIIKDPNYGRNPPDRREIDEFCEFWEYGFSQFIPIRFSNSDPWGKMGWAWPRMKDGQPLPASHIGKIASYMTKYIMKSADNKGEAKWRTKTDRALGLRGLRNTLRQMKIKPLISLVKYQKQPNPIMLYGNKIPTRLIRNQAVKELVRRMKKKRLQMSASPKNTTLKTLMRHGIKTKLDPNSTNIGDSLLRLFNGRATSKVNLKYFMEAREQLETALHAPPEINQVSGGNTDNR